MKSIRKSPGNFFVKLALLVCIALAPACQAFPFEFLNPATPTETQPAGLATPDQQTPLPTKTPEVTAQPEQPPVLRLWLPPQFDPAADTAASLLLRQRLDAFTELNPEINLEVRIKSENGPGGLIAALSAASISAPQVMPDLIALPRSLLEAAALKGLIHPWDGLTAPLSPANWNPFAIELGYVQDSTFGLPFAADLLVMVQRSAPVETPEVVDASELPETDPTQPPPSDWSILTDAGSVLAFPAADRQALFTLLLYRSVGGNLVDVDGRPTLDEAALVEALTLYQQANLAGVLPDWLTQIETDEQVWDLFTRQEVNQIITWASSYLRMPASDQGELLVEVVRPPTNRDRAYTLASGWVWALASPSEARFEQAGELAAFLVESSFLAEWNAAAGYLPPRPSALRQWEQSAFRDLVINLSANADLAPFGDVLAVVGPLLRQAAMEVLKQQLDPATAANAAVTSLDSP